MSDIRQILVLVNDSPRSDRVLALAARLARRHGAALAPTPVSGAASAAK